MFPRMRNCTYLQRGRVLTSEFNQFLWNRKSIADIQGDNIASIILQDRHAHLIIKVPSVTLNSTETEVTSVGEMMQTVKLEYFNSIQILLRIR
jgi:hypothetical protein